jgi:predicted 3-demethylubiquinone-9 3-methyltransferase (glyoxalase superfamily)
MMNDFLAGPDAAGSQRATAAMLQMKKIDLGAMERAYLSA